MPRPCPCDKYPAAGEPFDAARHCPLCYTWHRHPDSPAAKAWKGETVAAIRAARAPAAKPADAAAAWLAAGPCVHRGEPTGEVRDCGTCSGKVPVPLLGCRRHGVCHATAGKFLYGVTRCQECPDQAAEVVPGLSDPLPGPWRQPGPWNGSPAEVARHHAALRELAAGPVPDPPPFAGEGVVTCGGGRYWPGIVVMVRMLRECGSTLPVQVWYRGSCEPVDPADVAGLGVELIDADAHAAARGGSRVPRGRATLGGWGSKLYALTHTTFEVCAFIDADAYFVSDPAPLLALGRRHGFAAWTERGIDNVRWPLVGFPERPGDACPTIQGGQFAIDRRRLWREIVLTQWVCSHEDFYWPAKAAAPHEYGRPLFGDQDAWRLSFQHTGFRPHVVGTAEFRPGWGYLCWLGGVVAVEHRAFQKLVPTRTAGEARALAHFAEHLGGGDPAGWLSGEEARLLRETCRGKRVLEWGRFHGRSTAVIAAAAEHVWSVDRLTAAPAAAHLARQGLGGRATLVVGDYAEPATLPPWPPDVVYVDGDHRSPHVDRDLAAAGRLPGPGGAVCVHDYGLANAPDVRPAADRWARENGWELADLAGTMAVFRRPGGL